VRLVRVTFVGELGWEVYCPSEYGANLWATLWSAGQEHGLVSAGYRAIESLRLEKGYRVWGAELDPAHTPYEAGLGFCVKLDKPGGFLGRDALVAQKASGVERRLVCLVLDDPSQVALGNEPVLVDGEVAGRVTSGGIGFTVRSSVAFVYLPVEQAVVGAKVEVGIFGDRVAATITKDPLYDPTSARVRS
jgi:glycine cleavage system aminomethyltransferase T